MRFPLVTGHERRAKGIVVMPRRVSRRLRLVSRGLIVAFCRADLGLGDVFVRTPDGASGWLRKRCGDSARRVSVGEYEVGGPSQGLSGKCWS